jgi:hypothetical protein
MFQRLETAHPCPRAAVLAALLLIRVAERRTGPTWRQIAMHLVQPLNDRELVEAAASFAATP